MKLADIVRGSDRGGSTLRAGVAAVLIVASAGFGSLGFTSTAAADHQSLTNSSLGTVKIDGAEVDGTTDNSPSNTPHNACDLRLEWFDFPHATYNADGGALPHSEVAFQYQGGANNGQPVPVATGDLTPTFSASGAQESNHVEVYRLAPTVAAVSNGWHVKVTVTTTTGYSKFKVFWLQPCPSPSLTVLKSNNANGDTAFNASETATTVGAAVPFRVEITNNRNYAVTISSITDSIDAGAAQAVSCVPAVTSIAANGSATCDFTLLSYAPADGVTKNNVITVNAHQTGNVANSASPTSNTSSVTTDVPTTPAPSLTVLKSNNANGDTAFNASETATTVGAAVPFRVEITNNRNYAVTISSITDSIDAGAAQAVSCVPAVTSIAANGSATCDFTLLSYAPADGVTKNNVITVNAHQTGNVANSASPTSNTSSVTTNVPVVIPPGGPVLVSDLTVQKTGPATVDPGDVITWALTVTSKGTGAASGFTVTDTVPAGVTITTMSGSGFSCDLGTARCTHAGSLSPGSTAVVTAVGVLSDTFTGTSLTNVVVVGPSDGTDDNSDSLVTAVTQEQLAPADLVVEKTAPTTPTVPNGTVVWTVTVTNAGGSDSDAFELTDTLGNGLTLVSAAGDGFSCSPGSSICTHEGLAAGEQATLLVTTLLSEDWAFSSAENFADAPLEGDPTPMNNSDEATVGVALPIDGGSEEPATGGSPSPTPTPSKLPFADDDEQEPSDTPSALPFTGSSTDLLLGLGAGLSVIGLMLALAGRRHRTAE